MINVIEDIITKYNIEKKDSDWLKMVFEDLQNQIKNQQEQIEKLLEENHYEWY